MGVSMKMSTFPLRMQKAVDPYSPSRQMTSPGAYVRRTTAPRFSSRKFPDTPRNIGKASSSSASRDVPTGSSTSRTSLFVNAPVGQETMHSPHETHEESAIG